MILIRQLWKIAFPLASGNFLDSLIFEDADGLVIIVTIRISSSL